MLNAYATVLVQMADEGRKSRVEARLSRLMGILKQCTAASLLDAHLQRSGAQIKSHMAMLRRADQRCSLFTRAFEEQVARAHEAARKGCKQFTKLEVEFERDYSDLVMKSMVSVFLPCSSLSPTSSNVSCVCQ